MKKQKIEQLTDDLGLALSVLAAAKENADELKKQLIANLSPGESIEGELFRAVYVKQNTNTVAWKAVAEKAGASQQLIRGNTKKGTKEFIKVSARNADQQAA